MVTRGAAGDGPREPEPRPAGAGEVPAGTGEMRAGEVPARAGEVPPEAAVVGPPVVPTDRLPGAAGLVRNFAWNLSGGGWGVLLALVSTPLVVHSLGAAQYGIYALLGVILSYLSFTELGLSKAVERHSAAALGSGTPERVTGYFGTALWLQVGIATAVGGAVALAGPPLLHLFQIDPESLPQARAAIRWVALNLAINFVAGVPQALLQAHQRFALLNRISIVSQTILTLLVVAAAVQVGTLVAVVVALVAATALRGLLLFVFGLRQLTPLGLPFDRTALGELLRFGGALTLTNVLNPLLSSSEKLMLGAFVSASSLTFYMVPFRVLSRLSLVSASLRRALFPVLSRQEGRGDLEGMRATNLRATELLGWLLLPGFAVFWAAGGTLLGLWMGEEFAVAAAPILPYLTIGTFFNLLAVNAIALIHARGRPGVIARLYVIELVLYLPASWWLMTRFGITGAAAAWCGRVVLDFALLWYTALTLIPGRRRFELPLWKPVATAVLVFAAGLLLERSMVGTAQALAAAGALAAGTGLATVRLALSAGERQELGERLRRRWAARGAAR